MPFPPKPGKRVASSGLRRQNAESGQFLRKLIGRLGLEIVIHGDPTVDPVFRCQLG
jgi:hypothetical protein